ncbi:hypothetical protein HanPSC8_Chr03g0130681 [Helianthus annuus]|nr:hypothetical protein HanPSC8_Chr03g0130681 [Helianthus annuus]
MVYGLKARISRGHQRNWRTEPRSDEIPSEASPRTYTQRSSPLHSPFGSGSSSQKDTIDQLSLHSPFGKPPKNGLDKTFSDEIYTSFLRRVSSHPFTNVRPIRVVWRVKTACTTT